MDQQTEPNHSIGRGALIRPWLWLWLVAVVGATTAMLLLEVSAGESLRRIDLGALLVRALFAGSVLAGFIWVLWMLRHLDEPGGRPMMLFLLAAVLGFILCTILFYTVEDYRGKRAWLKCVQISRTRGDKLTLAELAPPAVPDDQNFAMQPIWVETVTDTIGVEKARSWYGDLVEAYRGTNQTRPLDLPLELSGVLEMTNYTGSWQLAERIDLARWQDYYRQLALRTNYFPVASAPQSPAEDVLRALSRSDDSLERLRAAGALPYARFPLNYTNENPTVILLPHLAKLKGVVQFLRLRACAELRAGQADSALADIRLMLRLNDALRAEPYFISHLVHIAIFQIEIQPVWEGLADRRWDEAQLKQLDGWLARLDFLRDYTNAMAGERAFGCQTISYLEHNRREFRGLMAEASLPGNLGEHDTLMSSVARVIPRGWFDQNQAVVWHFYDEHLNHLIDTVHRSYSKSNAVALANAESKLGKSFSPYNRLAAWLVPALAKGAEKFAYAQQILDFARLGIALERYRLAQGRFPDALEALTPTYLASLPQDVVTGAALHYRRTESDGFILYSVGWNETDDGGQVGLSVAGRPRPDSGDWVWRSPSP